MVCREDFEQKEKLNLDQENVLEDDVHTRVENSTEGFSARILVILPLAFLFHVCFFTILFTAGSGVIKVKVPKVEIVQIDVVPDLTLKKHVIEIDLDKRVPVDPTEINPKKLETTKGETKVQPELKTKEKMLSEVTPAPVPTPEQDPTPTSTPELIPTPSPGPTPDPTPTPYPDPNPTPTPIPQDTELFILAPPDRLMPHGSKHSFGTDLRDGLDSIVIDCLQFLEFTESAQPCLQPKPAAPESVPVTEECHVKIDIMADGTVENFSTRDCPHPDFLEATRIAVKDWRYVPAVVGGKKVVERDRAVKVIFCEADENYITHPSVCFSYASPRGYTFDKPITLGSPRTLDKEALEDLDRFREFSTQSIPSQGSQQDEALTDKSPKKKLSLDEILK